MSAEQFSVVFTGDLAPEIQTAEAQRNFQQKFRLSEDKAARLFSGGVHVLKKGATREVADKYRNALADCGLLCELRGENHPPGLQRKPAPPPREEEAKPAGKPAPEVKLAEKPIPESPIQEPTDENLPAVSTARTEPVPVSGREIRVTGRPVGKIRGPGSVILLILFTLGFYQFVYYYSTFEELRNWRGQGWSGGTYLFFQFLFPIPLLAFPWLLPAYVGRMYQEDGEAPPISGWAGWWIWFPFLGYIIWICRIQNSLNRFWVSKGAFVR